ncbi:MAG: hypothetical protein OH319_01750 [Candidatus Parvarchaeota archaeon]|nr:hypothetical protein [Candidatus Jingweiarchaeum tengchongense]MCW1298093.1 hypothetical protein [Candidatus Jingweiarchaeum tengchongense]MCW1300791.1 hypothetical protein [Candidatus Jingweiarchaeum tengchongense]MCW1304925.1 hypothetical protein [Candidatus Jingweiarchaeum tengchongense]MCW1305515.1 hypothetical protein [Candidatus Jingweiarchaeum tengchongense]
MEKIIVLDSSTIISLSVNCLLHSLSQLKERTGVNFLIPPWVEDETVKTAVNSIRFRLEGIRIINEIGRNTIQVMGNRIVRNDAINILNLANNMFYAWNSPLRIIQKGEAEVLALCKFVGGSYIGCDEKTMRLIIENPENMRRILESKLHTEVIVNRKNLARFREIANGINVLRSADIVAIAFDMGVFDDYLSSCKDYLETSRSDFVKGFLWALRYSGCSISESEINDYIKYLVGR